VLNPLAEAGYLEWENPSNVTGKPNLVKTTDSFEADVLGPIITQVSDRVGVPRRILRLSLAEAYNQLETSDGYDRGLALEALAIKLGEALGLDFAGWRVRGQATGGSEVDVLMDDVGATHTRWQIQCKGALEDRITADTVAREVGVAQVVNADTLLLVVRGGMTDEADRFATQVMQRTSLTVLKLTEADLKAIVETPDVLYTRLAGQAERAHRIKRLDPGRADLALPGEGIQTEGSTIMDELGLTQEAEETASTDLSDFTEDSS